MKKPERQPGVVSVGRSYSEGGVHLVSNYLGLDSFMETDLPRRRLRFAFISTASKRYPELSVLCRFLDAERAWLEQKRAEGRINYSEFCIGNKEPDEIADAMGGVDVIFMGGGNTQYLLEKIQDSGAGDVIKGLVDEGVRYLGKSAGAIVAGPDIDPRGFFLDSMATRPLVDTTGLGLVQVFPLPHIDTPSVMGSVHNGKTGWQHAVELCRRAPTAYILDGTD